MSGANDNTARSFCTLLVLILSVLHALLSQTVLAQLSQSAAPTALSKKTPSTDGITPVTSTVRRGPVTAQASLSARTVRIGQSVRLELNVSAPSGVELLMPTFGEALGRFTILDFAPATTIEASGKVRATQRYELLMERSGDHRIAPILVEFVDRRSGAKAAPQGEDAYELLTEPLLLTVLKLTDDEAKQALVPPLTALPKRSLVEREPATVAALVVVACVIAVLLLVIWWRWRQRPPSPESAYALAIRRLTMLRAQARGDATELDAFFVELSGLVREYVENRFGLHAPELTTEEFLHTARDNDYLTGIDRDFLGEFLSVADRVKFAGYVPASTNVDAALDAVDAFLHRTATSQQPLSTATPSASTSHA